MAKMGLGLWVRYARAEGRRSRGILVFCVLSIALGVASLTGIHGVIAGLKESIATQSRSILGADLALTSNQSLTGEIAQELHNDLTAMGARSSAVTTMNSMVSRVGAGNGKAGTKTTQFVQLKALNGQYPLYGAIETQPAGVLAQLASSPSVVLDPAIQTALGLSVGDRVAIGDLNFVFLGTFRKQPGTVSATFSFAPAAYIASVHLPATNLVRAGSRVSYERLYRLTDSGAAESWKAAHFNRALDERITIQSFRDAAANVQRFLRRLEYFLTVVALVTLLLGALGIASAMNVFARRKLDNAAMFRCLGATPRQVLTIYSLWGVGVGALGSAMGVLIGACLPLVLGAALSRVGAEFLPVTLVLDVHWSALGRGFIAGVGATIVFSLLPMVRIARVAPLRALRRTTGLEVSGERGAWSGFVGTVLTLGFVSLLALAETKSATVSLLFALTTGAVLLLLGTIARGLVVASRSVATRVPSYPLRQGLANLHRPGNQTVAMVVAVGIGVFLIMTIGIVDASLRGYLSIGNRDDIPNVFLMDVQTDQIAGVQEILKAARASSVRDSPMIAARIAAVNGRPIDTTGVRREAVERTWNDRMRTREYFISYRESTLESEQVVDGKFWRGRPQQQEASIDVTMATNLGIVVGDTMTLDIQGIALDAKVTSTRRIEWEALALNSMIVLSPGEVAKAPKMYAVSFRVPEEAARGESIASVVRAYPNVSAIDVTEAAQTVRLLVGRLSSIVGFLALLTIVTGTVVIGGAVAASRFVRIRETMLLKVLGAGRRHLLYILAAEYTAIAWFGGVSGWGLAEVLNRSFLPMLFRVETAVPYPLVAVVFTGVIVINLVVSLGLSRGVAATSPLGLLKED